MSRRLPTLLDFNCAHPGCGAHKGFRCTFTGYRFGHPIRQQRLVEETDRRIDAIHGRFSKRRTELETHREMVTGAMRWTTPRTSADPGPAVTGADIALLAVSA